MPAAGNFAVVSTYAGFISWLAPKLTCGSMLEVSHDAVAVGEEQLVSCAAEQSQYHTAMQTKPGTDMICDMIRPEGMSCPSGTAM